MTTAQKTKGKAKAKKKKGADFRNEVITDLKKVEEVVKGAIDQGAKSVEEVHQTVAELPLKYLEKIGPLEGTAKNAKEIQEKTIGHVYKLLRAWTDTVDDVAQDLLDRAKPKATRGS